MTLSVVPLKSDAPRPEVVEKACEFFNLVVQGKVDGFALVILNKDESISTFVTPCADKFRLFYGVDRLRHRLHTSADQEQ